MRTLASTCIALVLLVCTGSATAAVPPGPALLPRAGDAAGAPAGEAKSAIVDMETMVVTGAQPGPGLWRVHRDGHVLYILGTLSPLPRRMEWIPDKVEATIASSQAVIDPPSIKLDAGVGRFRGLLLLPSLLKARRNPDGRTLRESVPADMYARWAQLKPRYIGRNAGIERWRPVFAAQELYEAAMRKAGLSQANVVSPVVAAAAKRHGVPRIPTLVEVTVTDPKALIREFNATTLSDTDCFSKTLARIETDLDGMRQRANAWAIGDVAALRELPMEDQYVACMRAFTGNAVAQKIGFGDVSTRSTATWVAAAERALQANASTFATLPIPFLLREKGVLATLQGKGYTVEAPDQ